MSLYSRRRRLKVKKKTKPYKPPDAEDLDSIVGRWKIDSVRFDNYNVADTEDHLLFQDYAGVEVTLDDQCDVTWTLPPGVEPVPLFTTASFNIEKDSLELFGGQDGKSFSFDVGNNLGDGTILLSMVVEEEEVEDDEEMRGILTLMLVKSTAPLDEFTEGFNLQGALDEGYFSDLTLKSSEGSEFKVHRTVLGHSVPNMSARDWEMLLASLPTGLGKVVLSYVYSHRLPTTLPLPVARELLSALTSQPRLAHLSELCRTFIGRHDLKQRIMRLVDDLQAALELAKKMVDNTDMANPVKVTYTIKQLAKEAAVGAAKFCMLCELYSRNKKDMSKPEKQEVLEYVRARVVVFVDLLSELIDSALSKYTCLTEAQRTETATYIIPEVERIWDLINLTCEDVKTAMKTRLSSQTKRRGGSGRPDIKVSLLIQLVTHGKEAKRLATIGKEFEEFLQASSSKREDFNEMTEAEKVAKVLRAIEGLEKEGHTQRSQLQAAKAQILMDNALDWKKFKVLTSLCCTYVSWGLRRAQHLKEPMVPSIIKACKFVQRSEFNEALLYLDLLTESDVRALREDDSDEAAGPHILPRLAPPTAVDNQLARGCFKLLGNDLHTDMEFVLHSEPEGCVVSAESGGVVIKVHRVIVASRCEWIKRALLSGMKEAIDKRIVVRDCSEGTFRLFLCYLYGGPLELDTLPITDVVDLLAAADQYETSVLRSRCEGCLVRRVEDGTVFPLLQVADRYSVRRLRVMADRLPQETFNVSCGMKVANILTRLDGLFPLQEVTLQHILNDHDVIMREVEGYSDLADDLKQELRTLLSSPTDPHLLLRHTQQPMEPRTKTNSSSSDSSDDVPPAVLDHPPFELDEMYHPQTTIEFQEKLDSLRAIAGEEANDDMLREFLLAANMDLNRAVNFFLNTQ